MSETAQALLGGGLTILFYILWWVGLLIIAERRSENYPSYTTTNLIGILSAFLAFGTAMFFIWVLSLTGIEVW